MATSRPATPDCADYLQWPHPGNAEPQLGSSSFQGVAAELGLGVPNFATSHYACISRGAWRLPLLQARLPRRDR